MELVSFCVAWLPHLGVAAVCSRILIWILLKMEETCVLLIIVTFVSILWATLTLLWMIGMVGFVWLISDAVRSAVVIYGSGG